MAIQLGVEFRIGQGIDIHRLEPDRPFILGGVLIPFSKGPLGHSDADALLHAIIDALLGATALGDIGQHFPDSDPQWQGASSVDLLQSIWQLVQSLGWQIENIDCTVMLQEPKLASYVKPIREKIANTLEIEIDRISVKATTSERLGFIGEGLALQTFCTLLLKRTQN
jgi:2-C-methyl-D-erythritol 2,4-cyclodiphosphate synthase